MGKTWVPNRQRQTDHPCQGQVRSSAWPPHRRRRGGDSSPASGGTELRETPTVISFTPPPRQRVAAGAPLPLRSRRPRPLRGAASQSHAPPPAPPPRRSPRRPCLGGGVEPGHATAGVPRDLRRRPVSGSIGYTRGLTAAEVDFARPPPASPRNRPVHFVCLLLSSRPVVAPTARTRAVAAPHPAHPRLAASLPPRLPRWRL